MGLLNSIPKLAPDVKELDTIEGEVQNLMELPGACFFAGRCRYAEEKCRTTLQVLEEIEKGRTARCWKAKELPAGSTARS